MGADPRLTATLLATGSMPFAPSPPLDLPPRDEIAAYHLADESRLVGGLIERAHTTEDERRRTGEIARNLVHAIRANPAKQGGIDAFMTEYGLTSEEGIMLMCLAEALLRIPDSETADALIADKIAGGQWDRHLGASDSLFVNASTFGLMLTGRLVKFGEAKSTGPLGSLKRLVARSGEPVIRQALRQAMKILGDNFVLGRTIKEAIANAQPLEKLGYRYSYDMLGEGAKTHADADRYFQRYVSALDAVGKAAGPLAATHADALMARPGLSVKLSAIHPRFEPAKADRLAVELTPRVVDLAAQARARGLTLTLDAEEQDRLDLELDLFARAFLDPRLEAWGGLGVAVQAYGKRAIPTLRWLRRLAEKAGKRIPVRLVKGAYWDSEIKWAQERGLEDYPVYTRKIHTDLSYLACMRLLLSDPAAFYPQFATHNAHSVASAFVAGGTDAYEFQRLHGMGEALYDQVVGDGKLGRACRIYAPVGGHEDLLAYLVRRLLENGANTSFVNRLADEKAPIEDIVRDPVEASTDHRERNAVSVMGQPKPSEIFAPARINSAGLALTERRVREDLVRRMGAELAPSFAVGPIVDGETHAGAADASLVLCPHDRRERIGTVQAATVADIDRALSAAATAAHRWDRTPVDARAAMLDRAAELFERDAVRLMAVIVREAGKTHDNAHGDIREAVDFLRYYAAHARATLSKPTHLAGPTGERNLLEMRGRGPFVAIAPWNFPLAIFTGQVAAALVAGNPVLAKPAAQTPITAFLAVELMHEAGIPHDVLHLLTGGGAVGAALVKDRRTAGVVFTGSNATAQSIQRALVDRGGPILPFIAETGGINAMIADSSALPEQVVRDVVRSAFDSAGQRCSAARVLFLQDDVAKPMIEMLVGAMQTLEIGDPMEWATDIGPARSPGRAQAAHAPQCETVARSAATDVVPCWHLRDASRLRDRAHWPTGARGVRSDIARDQVQPRPSRSCRRGDQCNRLWSDAWAPQPHRDSCRLRRRACPCRQSLHQPQPDRRDGRHTAVRWRGTIGHWPKSRWAALSVPLRDRACTDNRHHGNRRQRAAPGPRCGQGLKRASTQVASAHLCAELTKEAQTELIAPKGPSGAPQRLTSHLARGVALDALSPASDLARGLSGRPIA
jgi:RHH-type transcriptional regulator, proline utilization regulon repressor / proline dehydrogenase / delta 1-pyrroline-5-carboxylate dehydrogenase